jgi:hypothetical protein
VTGVIASNIGEWLPLVFFSSLPFLILILVVGVLVVLSYGDERWDQEDIPPLDKW